LEDFRSHSDLIEGDVYTALALDATLDAKRVVGGTSRTTVATALAEARDRLTGEASN